MNCSRLDFHGLHRFFSTDGASFTFLTIYAKAYQDLGCLITHHRDCSTVWLADAQLDRSRADGLHLLVDKDRFSAYQDRFDVFLLNCDLRLSRALEQPDASQQYLSVVEEFLSLYRYTEFFFTDQAYAKSLEFPELALRLRDLERTKARARGQLNRLFNGSSGFLERLMKNMAQQHRRPIEQLRLFSIGELCSPKLRELSHDIELRSGNFLLYFGSDEWHVEVLHHNMQQKLLMNDDRSVNCIRGVTASMGEVVAPARVLVPNFNNYDELESVLSTMRRGEILVTETTSPELVVICGLAAGIVTNQGGLGSHAATISRELGIPCIVGTENATKAICTGDLIKIDGRSGTVHVIRRTLRQAKEGR